MWYFLGDLFFGVLYVLLIAVIALFVLGCFVLTWKGLKDIWQQWKDDAAEVRRQRREEVKRKARESPERIGLRPKKPKN